MPHILVVDDESDLRDIVAFNLQAEGYQVATASSGEEALAMDLTPFSLILLDVMMGELSGFDVARRLKANNATAHLPIIFLTALGSDDDAVRGLDLGADDYIAKPFSVRQLLSRVKAVLRRTQGNLPVIEEAKGGEQEAGKNEKGSDISNKNNALDNEAPLAEAGVRIDADCKLVTIDGQSVSLTPTEYLLLELFVHHPHRVFSRQELIQRVWPDRTEIVDRAVDVCVMRLRKKLGPYSSTIATRPGFGYYYAT